MQINEREREVILAYAANNMNRSAAGRQIYLSRSGMSKWLDNIKRDTGLDPRNFYDLHSLVEQIRGEGYDKNEDT